MTQHSHYTETAEQLLHSARQLLHKAEATLNDRLLPQANANIQMAAVYAQLADTAARVGSARTEHAPSRLRGDLVVRSYGQAEKSDNT